MIPRLVVQLQVGDVDLVLPVVPLPDLGLQNTRNLSEKHLGLTSTGGLFVLTKMRESARGMRPRSA